MSVRVLVVDDEKLLVKGIKFNLENDGYTVDGAYDGADALELFKENKYDIVILDLMLPGLDGLTVCRRIRYISPSMSARRTRKASALLPTTAAKT